MSGPDGLPEQVGCTLLDIAVNAGTIMLVSSIPNFSSKQELIGNRLFFGLILCQKMSK